MKQGTFIIILIIISIFSYSCKKRYTCLCHYTTYETSPKEVLKIDTIPATDSTPIQITLDTVIGYDTIPTNSSVSYDLRGMKNEVEAKTGCYIDLPYILESNCNLD